MIESSSPKAPNRPRATVATWAGKNVSPSWLFQALRLPDGYAGVEIANHLADSSCHLVRGPLGGIWPGPHDERCFRISSLRDREELCCFLIFTERYVFSILHDAHDPDRLAGGVLEIAADRVVGVEEAPSELPIHNAQPPGSS